MPKFRADDSDAAAVLALFAKRKGLRHLRVRRHVDTLVIESDDVDDPFKWERSQESAAFRSWGVGVRSKAERRGLLDLGVLGVLGSGRFVGRVDVLIGTSRAPGDLHEESSVDESVGDGAGGSGVVEQLAPFLEG